MMQRLRWMLLGVVLLVLVVLFFALDLRGGAVGPSPLLIELAKARGFVEAERQKSPEIREVIREVVREIPADVEPVASFHFATEFEHEEPPEIEFGPRFGDETFRRGRRQPRACPTEPNWTLRRGDLAGSCQAVFIEGAPDPLGHFTMKLKAQTPHGVVQRSVKGADEALVDFWAARKLQASRWQAIGQFDVLVPLSADRPAVAVLGASWFKGGRRLGFNARGGYGFGGSEIVQLGDGSFRFQRSGWYLGGGLSWRLRK